MSKKISKMVKFVPWVIEKKMVGLCENNKTVSHNLTHKIIILKIVAD